MKPPAIVAIVVVTVFASAASATGLGVRSYFPKKHLPQFLVHHLDLASFRNSMAQRRENTFVALGVKEWAFTRDEAIHNSNRWYYSIRVIKIGDINRDGIEDVEICFRSKAHKGTYNVQRPVLVTRYSNSGPVIAIKYKVFGCKFFK